MRVRRRHAARAVLLDPDDRVLLFWLDPGRDPSGHGYWYLPGGEMEAGETPEKAVARELREEIGVEDAEIGPRLVHLRGVRFEFGGRLIEQDEWHVLARTRRRVVREQPGDNEVEAIAGHRWWTVGELETATALIHPAHLARTVAGVVAAGPPAVPLEIDDAPTTGRGRCGRRRSSQRCGRRMSLTKAERAK